MKKSIAVLACIFSLICGVALATDHHRNERVVERVVEKVEVREVPKLQKVRVVERVVDDNHHHHNQNVEKIIIRERVRDNHHDRQNVEKIRIIEKVEVEKVRDHHDRSSFRVEKQVQRSRGRLFGRR